MAASTAPPRPRPTATQLVALVTLPMLGVLASALVLEAALRISYPTTPAPDGRLDVRGMHRPSEIDGLVWELKPGTYLSVPFAVIRVSPSGLRDREFPLERPPGVRRVAVLGDSVTFGVGVDQERTYPKVLEQLLNQSARTVRYEVMNFGVPGYNTAQEYALLREKALRYQPDVVVVGFVMNDGNSTPLLQEVVRQEEAETSGQLWSAGRRFLREHSYLYTFLTWRIEALGQRLGLIQFRGYQYESILGLVNPSRLEEETPDWRRARKALEDIVALLKEHRIPVVLVVFPLEIQMEDPRADPERERRMATRRMPQERLRDLAKASGTIYVDLLPLYSEWARRQALFLDFYSHPNDTGHRLAAEAVFLALREHGLME